MKKRSFLIVTTPTDRSVNLFLSAAILEQYQVSVLFFTDTLEELRSAVVNTNFDFIYLRDPLNNGTVTEIDKKINLFLQSCPTSTFIDKIQTIDDIYFEDKWLQYQKFSDVMAKTTLLSDQNDIDYSVSLIKKRISSGARGLILSSASLDGESNEYIVQEKLDIDKEYRVLTVKGHVLPIVASKNISIGQDGKPKMRLSSPSQIDEHLSSFTSQLQQRLSFDLVGYDIARLRDGSYKLIEVNRSPQVIAYYRETGINVIEKLLL